MSDPADSLELTEADKQLSSLARDLANDPKTRKDFLRLIKAKHPDRVIPELDTEEQMRKFAEPYIKEQADLKKKLLERDVRDRIEAERSTLRDAGYSKDDIAAIEKLMTEKHIPSHATAAEHYKMSKTLSTPTPSTLTRAGTNKLPVDKKALKESGGIKNWARDEAHKAADDIKSGRVKLH